MSRLVTPLGARAAALLVVLPLVVATAPRAAGAQQAGRPAGAPPAVQPERQRAAIDRLAAMVGEWQGEGWIDQGNGRATFRGGERVERKLDGLALLVEGRFTTRLPGASEEVPIHTTLGVISFDPRAERYRFHTWLASGATGEHELVLTNDGWRWELESPAGMIRYSTSFAGGEWAEVGEIRRGDGGWHQFFEMRLRRVGAGG